MKSPPETAAESKICWTSPTDTWSTIKERRSGCPSMDASVRRSGWTTLPTPTTSPGSSGTAPTTSTRSTPSSPSSSETGPDQQDQLSSSSRVQFESERLTEQTSLQQEVDHRVRGQACLGSEGPVFR